MIPARIHEQPRPRAKLAGRKLTTHELAAGHRAYPLDEHPYAGHGRPETRGQCHEARGYDLVGRLNPCPFASCRHNLSVDVDPYTGEVRLTGDLFELPDTCALDVADRDGVSQVEVAAALGISRQAVEQCEDRAMSKLSGLGAAALAEFAPPVAKTIRRLTVVQAVPEEVFGEDDDQDPESWGPFDASDLEQWATELPEATP